MKLTTLQVAEYVDNDDCLDHPVMYDIHPSCIENHELREAWAKARETLLMIDEILEEALNEALDEFGAE